MSYTSITGMRSNRYPLMGMGDSGDGLGGCGCGGGSAQPIGYLGTEATSTGDKIMGGVVVSGIMLTALGVGLYQFYKIATT
jgi:hypothetical protein